MKTGFLCWIFEKGWFFKRSDYYNNYLDRIRVSYSKGLYNWINRVLNYGGCLCRNNSFGETMPENWQGIYQNNTAYLQKLFHENKIDLVFNEDQNVLFLSYLASCFATKFTKRVEIKVKSDTKVILTSMITCKMDSRKITSPILVYNARKFKDTKYKRNILA